MSGMDWVGWNEKTDERKNCMNWVNKLMENI